MKRQIEGLDTPTSAKELLSEMLTHSPRTRIAPLLLSQQAEDLADTLKGPSLHTWCFARNWNEAPSEEGLMDGRTMDESFPFDAPPEDEETESIHEPNTERERLPGQDFIGRKREWAMLHALLNPGVTLLKGPGGIGKSRLALEVCQDGDRQRYVRAASARTKEELVWIVASELELTLRPGSTADQIQQVSARLAASPLTLLVLDNLEQLKPEAFEAIEMWTQACPKLCILATSRRGLPLDEVRVLTLDPFSSEEALALYIRRARERVPDYTPDSTEANDIQALGQAMGGLPLAIELAASRVRTVSPAQFRDPKRSLNLSGKATDHSAKTLLECLQRTWDLLTPEQQRGWMAASCFADTFTQEAWQATMGDEGHEQTWLSLLDLDVFHPTRIGLETRYFPTGVPPGVRETAAKRRF